MSQLFIANEMPTYLLPMKCHKLLTGMGKRCNYSVCEERHSDMSVLLQDGFIFAI